MIHINGRGSHTTVIDEAKEIVALLKKAEIGISPGLITRGGGVRSKSLKLKKINNEVLEMVVVVKSSKQIFKIYSQDQDRVFSLIADLRKKGWIIPEIFDVSMAE